MHTVEAYTILLSKYINILFSVKIEAYAVKSIVFGNPQGFKKISSLFLNEEIATKTNGNIIVKSKIAKITYRKTFTIFFFIVYSLSRKTH